MGVDLYKGDFLVGDFEDWIVIKRRSLKNIFLTMSNFLIKNYFNNKKYQKCIELTNKILKSDDCQENAYYYQMKSYYQLQDKVSASKTYHKCEKTLNKKLDISPPSKIIDFFNNIR